MKTPITHLSTQTTRRSRWSRLRGFLLAPVACVMVAGSVAAANVGDNLTVSFTLPETGPVEHEPFPMRLTVCNDGTPAVFAIAIRDEIPAGMAIQSVTANIGSCNVNGQIVTCMVPQLNSSQCLEVDVLVAPGDPGIVTNKFWMSVTDDVVAVPDDVATITMQVRKRLDYGDAPAVYPTLRSSDGARHRIVPGWHLGWLIDREPNGQPNASATGDDLNNLMDEDGVRFLTSLPIGGTAVIEVLASTNSFLDAWIDFNMNSSWEAAEQIFTSQPLVRGTNTLTFNIPAGIVWKGGPIGFGSTYSRFRMSRWGGLTPRGYSPFGEVEDYHVEVGQPDDVIIWEPDPKDWELGVPETVTVVARNVSAETLVDVVLVDAIPDGLAIQSATCSGGSCTVAGQVVTAQVDEISPFQSVTIDVVVVPEEEGDLLNSFWGYRNNNVTNVIIGGVSSIAVAPVHDFGDAPDPSYPTLLANNGARHRIVAGWYLGELIDAEPDGLPYSGGITRPLSYALGDDLHNLDDEDGVRFLTSVVPGSLAQVEVESSVRGMLDAWIDVDRDGVWETNEQIFASQPLVRGFNNLEFGVPAPLGGVGNEGQSYARFRLSRDGGLTPEGYAPIGEVEDYMVWVGGEPHAVPDLDLDIPVTELIEGEFSPLEMVLRNDGETTVSDVTVMIEFPEGMILNLTGTSVATVVISSSTAAVFVDALGPHQSLVINLSVAALESGTHEPLVTIASAESGIVQRDQPIGQLLVRRPLVLHIAQSLDTGAYALYWDNEDALLEEALNVEGPWRVIEDAESPHPMRTHVGPRRFFRLRLDPPVTGASGTGSSD